MGKTSTKIVDNNVKARTILWAVRKSIIARVCHLLDSLIKKTNNNIKIKKQMLTVCCKSKVTPSQKLFSLKQDEI